MTKTIEYLSGIDAVRAYLDDQIDATRNVIAALEPNHNTAHAHTALNTLQKVRSELEWLETSGYTVETEYETEATA